jgi:hypothetical protein
MTEGTQMSQEENASPITRRSVLKTASCGFGYLAFAGMCADARASEDKYRSPLAAKVPHFAPPAKRVIFLFMQGGPSHVDTFDYKPALQKSGGKGTKGGKLLPSPWEFKRHGKSGLHISALFPELAKHADDLCLINGMHTNNPAHPQATIMMHTGSIAFVRPSLGAWTVYGLGSENEDLPGFITINPPARLGGAQNYGSSFLPACYQGTRLGGGGGRGGSKSGGSGSLPNLSNSDLDAKAQRRQLDLIQAMNRDLRERSGVNHEIDGIIESYELAFRMQKAVPDVMDLKRENARTLASYGIGKGQKSDGFGRQCLMARRFAEAGVRFIEISYGGWDQHNNLQTRLTNNCGATDKPIAGLIADLKSRNMLDDTLIVWTGEFGRTPTAQGGGKNGRRHNNRGFTSWLAGGGIKGGLRHGKTDEFGAASVEDKVHVHDLHATVLHQLGLDHEKLTYRYAGRDFRLTDVYGRVVKEIIA